MATADQIVAALDEQLAKTPQFGKLALGRKLLTIQQIWHILNHQADHGGRFGEIGVSLGFLTENQVQQILVLQMESRPKIGELLVAAGVVSEPEMNALLERYRLRRMTDVLGPVPEAENDEWTENESHTRLTVAVAEAIEA
ncbi:MAG: hypothetical protein H6718_20120 [Polyangiaceae bacterium]|nr:hypothetical protein [Polyangiaceae bacterium]